MEKSDSRDSIRTTKSMKQKAHAISRCLISMIKIWRVCVKKKKKQPKQSKET